MNIGPLPAPTEITPSGPEAGAAGAGHEQAANNRELVKAIRAINENAVLGPGSELRFAVDRETGYRLIRIVDRITNEVLAQIPPEEVLRLAEVALQGEERARLART
jgi:uncharacterized FlaG/YvyC family protein